jgi:alpha-L-fucosidase
MSNYGRIDELWLDGKSGLYHAVPQLAPGLVEWPEYREMAQMIRKLQPEIMIAEGEPEKGPDQKGFFFTDRGMRTICTAPFSTNECTWTLIDNTEWHHCEEEYLISPREIVMNLVECACKQSNFLLNLSPRGDGSVPDQQAVVLRQAGQWLAKNGEAIYGVNAQTLSRMITSTWGRFALKGNRIYFYLTRWPADGEVIVGGIEDRIKRVRILSSGQELVCRQEGNRLRIFGLPATMPDDFCSVIVMER